MEARDPMMLETAPTPEKAIDRLESGSIGAAREALWHDLQRFFETDRRRAPRSGRAIAIRYCGVTL